MISIFSDRGDSGAVAKWQAFAGCTSSNGYFLPCPVDANVRIETDTQESLIATLEAILTAVRARPINKRLPIVLEFPVVPV